MTNTDTMLQDDGQRTYECGPDECGYDGDTYCQNCGYAADERCGRVNTWGALDGSEHLSAATS